MKHRNIAIAQDEVKPEEPAAQNADADDQGDNYDDEGPYSDEEYSDSDYSDEES